MCSPRGEAVHRQGRCFDQRPARGCAHDAIGAQHDAVPVSAMAADIDHHRHDLVAPGESGHASIAGASLFGARHEVSELLVDRGECR